jgi:glycosyltransferase involved in cell wall biosynthesis
MNILHIADVLVAGGLETYLSTLLNGLSTNNNVHLISQHMSLEMINSLNSNVFAREIKIDYPIYEKYIQDNNIEIIHGHPHDALNISVALGQKFNIPVVFTYHGLWGWIRGVHDKIDKMIVISNEVNEILSKDNRLNGKIEVIQNGIDNNKIYHKQSDVENTILFIGRIDPDKYYSIKKVIEGISELNIRLIVAGSGSHFDTLMNEVPEWVEMLGYVDNMNEVINNANIVIATGRGIREAMLCGKPCISMDACWYDGIVNSISIEDIEYCNFSGRSKNKVPINPNVIKRDIQYLLNKDIQKEIGNWSKNYALSNYTSDVFLEKHIKLYESVKR